MIGLEKEFFIVDEQKRPQIIPTTIPMDESGILAEARGSPSTNGVEAVYLLMAATRSLETKLAEVNQLSRRNWRLDDTPVLKVDRKTMIELSRLYAKPRSEYQNIYGFTAHKNSIAEHTAGIHISFTPSARTISLEASRCDKCNHRETKEVSYYPNWDYVQMIRKLDSAFASEIKAAKRLPGFYELKEDGRIEYRSLPANTPLDKIISFFEQNPF